MKEKIATYLVYGMLATVAVIQLSAATRGRRLKREMRSN